MMSDQKGLEIELAVSELRVLPLSAVRMQTLACKLQVTVEGTVTFRSSSILLYVALSGCLIGILPDSDIESFKLQYCICCNCTVHCSY
jgi:hypothetical protein